MLKPVLHQSIWDINDKLNCVNEVSFRVMELQTLRSHSGDTWHPVEEPLSGAIVGLQEATVHWPVQVCDEGGGAAALAHLLVALGDSIDIHQPVVWSHRQEGAIWRKLQLMDHLLPVLDVHDLRHVPEEQLLLLHVPQQLQCYSKVTLKLWTNIKHYSQQVSNYVNTVAANLTNMMCGVPQGTILGPLTFTCFY